MLYSKYCIFFKYQQLFQTFSTSQICIHHIAVSKKLSRQDGLQRHAVHTIFHKHHLIIILMPRIESGNWQTDKQLQLIKRLRRYQGNLVPSLNPRNHQELHRKVRRVYKCMKKTSWPQAGPMYNAMSGIKAPHILKLGTRLKRVVSTMLQYLLDRMLWEP